MPITAGDLFAHYRIVERVGEGGSGVVYRARDTRLHRDVALKLLSAGSLASDDRRRFQREGQALAALNHPNILTVHDVGEAGGRLYLVFEWMDGGPLGGGGPLHFDGLGIGLSGRFEGEFTEETRQLDLAAVLDAVGAEAAALLGISEGGWTAATYAVQHPGRIAQLVLYGAYARGAQARPGYDAEEDAALMTLIRKGWGRDTPAFRQVITSQFFRSDADPALIAHFHELQRVSANGETAARYYTSVHRRGDGGELFRQLRIPTLVIQCREDLVVPAEEGRLLASTITGAQLVLLPSGTHYFPTDPAVAAQAAGAITRSLHESASRRA